MEDINKVTPEQLSQLKGNFHERVKANNPEFHPNDMERVKSDELWLRRFVAHGEQDVETATNLLYDCCQWRKEFGVNELDHTKMDAALFEKGVLFIRNKDVFGKKLLIFKAKHHQKGTVEMDQLQKFIVYFFERIERESQSDQISIIFDMKDTGWQNMDMDFVRYLITLLKTYYPYFVNYLMIFEMPWLLNAAWKIIKGWLPPKFVDRVKFIDKKSIKDWIDVDNQLTDWGGNDDYVYKFEPEVRRKRNEANGRGQPVTKPRKVKLTVDTGGSDNCFDNEAAETPLVMSQNSSPAHAHARAAFAQGVSSFSVNADQDHCLAEVDERIVFKSNDNDEYTCRLHIQNIAQSGYSIIFKIKTTTPDRYRVRPTIAVIEPGGIAKVPITSQPGVAASQIQRDRFQVQVLIFPKDMVNDESCESVSSTQSMHHTGLADLNSTFKKLISSSAGAIDTFKVGVTVEPRAGDTSSTNTGPTVSMNEERMRKGLDDLEKKITDSVNRKIQPKIDRIQTLLYVTLAVLVILIAVIYFQGSSKCGAVPNEEYSKSIQKTANKVVKNSGKGKDCKGWF